MPWLEADFNTNADSSGEIHHERRLSPPVSGRLNGFRVQTTSNCASRVHTTRLIVFRDGDELDRLEMQFDVVDCVEVSVRFDEPFRVRAGQVYHLTLDAEGFDGGEHLEGEAAVSYNITFDLR